MHENHNTSFEFKENADISNMQHHLKQSHFPRPTKPNHQTNDKVIICSNPDFGINLEDHLNKLLKFYEEKILKESITKAVIGTFQKKNLISPGEFQLERALQDASNESKAYVDKIETWLGDSIAHSPALQSFELHKKRKQEQRAAKINSIIKLTQKIAEKLQSKKLSQIEKEFEQSLSVKQVKIPQNKEYSKAVYKMKFIKERVRENGRKWDGHLRDSQ